MVNPIVRCAMSIVKKALLVLLGLYLVACASTVEDVESKAIY